VRFAIALSALVGCGRCSGGAAPGSSDTVEIEREASVEPPPPMEAREMAQWNAAAQGDPEELMRLEDLVGCYGLRERADSKPDLLSTALRATQYCTDFSTLPWLVDVAGAANEADARSALETIDELAARPRRATDPDDADALHVGCGRLLDLARSTSRPRAHRALAVRALRMLTDRGCVNPADIPARIDGK
jgi:hypothetical protein